MRQCTRTNSLPVSILVSDGEYRPPTSPHSSSVLIRSGVGVVYLPLLPVHPLQPSTPSAPSLAVRHADRGSEDSKTSRQHKARRTQLIVNTCSGPLPVSGGQPAHISLTGACCKLTLRWGGLSDFKSTWEPWTSSHLGNPGLQVIVGTLDFTSSWEPWT